MARSIRIDALPVSSLRATTSTCVIVVLVMILAHRFTTTPKPYQLFPVWAPLEIALTSHLLSEKGLGRRILLKLRRNGGSLVGFSPKHQILLDSASTNHLMSHSLSALDPLPVHYTLITRVFGGVDSIDLKKRIDRSYADLRPPVERMFLNEAATTAILERAQIPEQVNYFVTFSSEASQKKRWEHSARILVIEPANSGRPAKVEANLQSLVRDFGASIAIPQLYGRDFLNRYPRALEDLWKFDNELFPLLMIGTPLWAPLKVVREGLAARTRILTELEALYRRIDQYQQGDPVDFGADMSDISETALGRNKIYRREGWSFPERGVGDIGLLWGQNANTQPVLFWLLTYVYSNLEILERLREEIAPYARMSGTTPREMTSLDIPGLSRSCQFLKACVYETYRLVNEPTSIRYVSRSVHVSDGELKHELKPGTFMSVPYSLGNRDASLYERPEKFDPGRFLEFNSESGKLVARYGRMKPWGSGGGICKGRTFAEKEIMVLGAAIISMWDIAPANGTWELPGMMPGTGVRKPTKDIRVAITRRV
ncbi:cytochrome p450 [Stemphylium lycopersici]|nr:cytochrome p450 [Stemphylium lycopersici]RAR03373.1 cytochrome p450 [Stemphylium lycopersici]